MLDYETDIPIEDKQSLRKEVDAIWKTLEGRGEGQCKVRSDSRNSLREQRLLRKGNGYGFVFEKGDDGKWRPLDDNQKKK